MKKLSIFIALIAIFVFTSVGSANEPLAVNQGLKAFTFNELGYGDDLLVGPYDASFMYFSLPPTWSLTDGGKISLTLTYILGGGTVGNFANNGNWVGGNLLVFYNGQLIDTILLDRVGTWTTEIEIPTRAYIVDADDGRQDIRFFLDASATCDYEDVQSSVFIHGVSFVDFSYNEVPPATDLNIFPRPIYQPDSLVPNRAKIVIPDDPTASELQAALTVSAGLGSITNGELDIDLIQTKDLSQSILNTENLIFVGLATKFPNLETVALPVDLSQAKGIQYSSVKNDDGVVQIALSPWSAANVVLVVTSNTEDGLIKAAQALSTGTLIPSGAKNLSIIASTSSPQQPSFVAEDITLAELGEETVTLGGYSGDYFSVDFYVSSDQVLGEGAYIELIATYSELMDDARTAFTVALNETTIASTSFAKANGDIFVDRIEILPNILRRGRNTLTFVSSFVLSDNCYAPDLDATWVTISGDSTLHLPSSTRDLALGRGINLRNFPQFLLREEGLEDMAVILPQNDLQSWNNAMEIAYSLGKDAAIRIARLSAFYANDIPEEVLQEKNLLVVGKASSLPILSDLNQFFPAPFPDNSDEAEQPALLVNYRLLPGVSVGYLELLPSPWNLDNVILAVMGNSEVGIPMATRALLEETLANQLIGNFSILYGTQVLSTDTRLGPTRDGLTAEMPDDAIVQEEAAPLAEDVTQAEPQDFVVRGTPDWIIPLLGASSLIILVLVIFVLRREAKMKVKNKGKK